MMFTPNPAKRTKRLLETAENELLDAEAQLENARAVRDAIAKRVQRLRAACQPAPTKTVESVTVGDITLDTPAAQESIRGLLRFTRRNQ